MVCDKGIQCSVRRSNRAVEILGSSRFSCPMTVHFHIALGSSQPASDLASTEVQEAICISVQSETSSVGKTSALCAG